MRVVAPLAVLCAILAAPAATAQPAPNMLELDLTPPDGVVVPAKGAIEVAVAWRVSYFGPGGFPAAQATDLHITWTHACPLVPEAPAPTAVAPTPGEDVTTGTIGFTLDPTRALGGERVVCLVTGIASDGAGQSSGEVDVSFTATIAYDGNITLQVMDDSRRGGPQKQVPYPIEVTNVGNARTKVVFDLAERPPGRWNILVPEAIVLDPGQTVTAIATVATPYENGFVTGSTDFVLRAYPSNVADDTQVGPPREVSLHSSVQGWYVPGPGVALLAVALGAAVAVARRS